MSNDHNLKVAIAEHQEEQRRKQRGLMSDQYNLDCSLTPFPTLHFNAPRRDANGQTIPSKPYADEEPRVGTERTRRSDAKVSDPVNQPAHYKAHPAGIECIQVTEHMGFNIGNAVKYLWRCDLKNDAIEDLKKAAWYIAREIAKREAKCS